MTTSTSFSRTKDLTIVTSTEALTQALVLAITAPTEAQATKAVTLAEAIARGLTKAQMERAKAKALRQVA